MGGAEFGHTDGLRHNPTESRDSHKHTGSEAMRQNRCPRCSHTVPRGKSQLGNGATWNSGQTDGNTHGTDRQGANTGRLNHQDHKDWMTDTQHAQRDTNDSPPNK